MGALGGVGMRSGVPSLALGSSMNSVMDGNGRMLPGLSVSLYGSMAAAATAAAAATDTTGEATPAGDASWTGGGADVVGEVKHT